MDDANGSQGTKRPRTAALIVNSKSRTGRDSFEAAKQCLCDHGLELESAIACPQPKAVMKAVKEAVGRKVPLVVVGGGDGSLSSVARYFVDSDSVMGVLPLGTGNQFARDLQIPISVEGACDTIVNGSVACVDMGFAGDDYFLNVATVGLSTLIAGELTPDAKKRLGRFVYVSAFVRAWMRSRAFQATLTTEQGSRKFPALQVVIGNGRYHAGPFPLSPNASITDGKLTVYALATANRWILLRYALNLPGGHQVEMPQVIALETKHGTLETIPVQRVTVDGEIAYTTPLKFGIRPAALHVMAPADFVNHNCPADNQTK